ncbi:MAG: His-Xaa-Ser repeat protein HxsA [Xanthomonadaceae bacterium]|nr:His-Xaa-Ser repeat protein HxsA [Xanthomonadaceae bacterium]
MRKSLVVTGAALAAAQGTAHGTDHAANTAHLTDLAIRDTNFTVTLVAPLNVNIHNMYASHASHSSHASHASHSSGSGGSYLAAPAYTPSYTPAYAPTPPPPAPSTMRNLGANASPLITPNSTRATGDQLKIMIMRVQAALYSKGYDPGAIDGVMTPETKLALAKFQGAHGLPVSSKMTTATLNALGVALGP